MAMEASRSKWVGEPDYKKVTFKNLAWLRSKENAVLEILCYVLCTPISLEKVIFWKNQKSRLPWVAVAVVVKSRKMVEKEKLNEAATKPGARLLSNPRRDSRQAGTGLDKSQNGQKQKSFIVHTVAKRNPTILAKRKCTIRIIFCVIIIISRGKIRWSSS